MIEEVDGTVQPFSITIPEAEFVNLSGSHARTHWPQKLSGELPWRGVPVEPHKQLVGRLRTDYDWRVREDEPNEQPQLTMTVDGQRVRASCTSPHSSPTRVGLEASDLLIDEIRAIFRPLR